jgi:hypothetical protein
MKNISVMSLLAMMVWGQSFGQNLDKHKWKNRLVLIQASDSSSKLFKEQLNEFVNIRTDLNERKLLIYQLVGEKYKILNGKTQNEIWKPADRKLVDQKVAFKVTLIGLDGGTKLEQNTVLKKEELFRIIDAMPMRISEMKH